MATSERELAIVTGASSGIGLELARLAAAHGYDHIIAADEPEIYEVGKSLADTGHSVQAIEADLSTSDVVNRLVALVESRRQPIGALMANAGRP